ncbi:hypothetical protein PRIC2_007859 [Phytophthora ramorum]
MGDAVVELGLHTAIIGVLLVHFNVLNLTIPILTVSLVIAYLVLFTGFCFVARSLTTSFVAVPYIAVKLQLKLVSLCFAYAARGFKPIFSEWTLAYELTILMMRYMSVVYGETIVNENTHLMREPFAMHGRMILKSSCRQHNTVPEKLVANGMEHMWMRDPEMKQHRVVVIHFHGGGFCIADPLQDVELANLEHTKLKQILKEKYECDVSVDVLLANYRKAPEFLYPTALNDCFDMYKCLSANCMRLRKENPELQPAAALCYSPVVDFSETDNDEKTPYCILAANFADNCLATYLRSVTDPKERHLWGDLERFYEQGLRFKAKAEAEGVRNMEFDILKNMVHDPVMFPTAVSPAAEKAITHACEFAAKHLVTVLRAGAGAEQEPEM